MSDLSSLLRSTVTRAKRTLIEKLINSDFLHYYAKDTSHRLQAVGHGETCMDAQEVEVAFESFVKQK
jgi:hypothetical protein